MNSDCSFLAITGGHCGSDSKDRSRSVDCVPLLSCDRDISAHKSAFTLSDVDNEVDPGGASSEAWIRVWMIAPVKKLGRASLSTDFLINKHGGDFM